MYSEYLNFAIDVAYKAGKIMLKYFNKEKKSSYKEDRTIVTIADTEINKYLIDKVKKKYPTHSVDGEELQFGESNYVWVCDPVDGTSMYARRVPVAVFSLALVIDGAPVVGVVYDPFMKNLYAAVKGEGAYLNGKKISVNNYTLTDVQSGGNFDLHIDNKINLSEAAKELMNKTKVYDLGSTVRGCMCVATGNFNFVIFSGTGHKNCDIAAAKIIVEEAGGKVTDIFGGEQRYDKDVNGAIISNGIIHAELVGIIQDNLNK